MAVNIHSTSRLVGKGHHLYGEGDIVMGPDGHINRDTIIQAWRECTVRLGRRVRIGPRCAIYTHSLMADQDFDRDEEDLKHRNGDVTIGDFVWLGAHVVVTPGVTIGENAVVAANSVVTRDVPPYAIAGGIPAKVVMWKSCRPEEVEP